MGHLSWGLRGAAVRGAVAREGTWFPSFGLACRGWDSAVRGLRIVDRGSPGYERVRANLSGQAQAGELPARARREEVAIGRADVGGRGDAGATAQNDLAGHELAVVLAEST